MQLCLEIETARISYSSPSNIHVPFAEKSENNDTKRQTASSYPIFDFSQVTCCPFKFTFCASIEYEFCACQVLYIYI